MAYQNIQLVISPGQSFVTGQFVQVIHDLDNYMFAQVLEYNNFTGYLLFTPVSVAGSGEYDSWTVVPAGSNGQATLYQGTSQTVIPVPTTTTTTTIYVPPAPTYFYYDVDTYPCPSCIAGLSIVARSSVSRITGFYYNIGDGNVYRVIAGVAPNPSWDVDLDGSAAGTTCAAACSI